VGWQDADPSSANSTEERQDSGQAEQHRQAELDDR
jgi:hypothetical protein